ncbi:MAG: DUF721 domain-containing protein [Deltaproteobacteria bacterium]|nr:DUF721 domain-containing protein [Deltaproteobacteria bacterium]
MARPRQHPVPIAEVVASYLSSCEARPTAQGRGGWTLKVLGAFRRIGPPVADHAEAASFRAGVLTLTVSESAWLTELTFLRGAIIERLNHLLGRTVVKDIRLRLGVVERKRPVQSTAVSLTAAQVARVESWAAEIANPEVRRAMMRAAAMSLSRGPPPIPLASGPPGPRLAPTEAAEGEEPGFRYGYGGRSWDRWRDRKG